MQTSSQDIPDNWAFRFFTIWTGQAFSLFGSALVQFALVWYLTRETSSATVLATATLVSFLPQIVLGPFVGTLVDRWNRRLIMIMADLAIAAATLGLAWLFTTDRIELWHIYAIMAIRSLGGSFHWPAMSASTSLMAPKEHLARISGMNQTLNGIIRIVAPPLGALLIELISTQNVLLVDVGTAALAVLPLLFISIPQPASRTSQADGEVKKSSYWQDLGEGFTYVKAQKGVLGLMLIAMALNLLIAPVSSFMPLMVTRVFNGGATELGWVQSLFGVGTIIGGVILRTWGGFKRRILTSLSGMAGAGIGILMMGLAPAEMFYLFLAAAFVFGFMMVFGNGPVAAIYQACVEPGMQGRVFSLLETGGTAMIPLGLLIAGPVSDHLGIRFWFILAGTVQFLMPVAASFVKEIMNIEENKDELAAVVA